MSRFRLHPCPALAFLLLAACGGAGGSGGDDGVELVAMIYPATGGSTVVRITSSGSGSLDGAGAAATQLFENGGTEGAIPRSQVIDASGAWILVLETDGSGREDLVAVNGATRRILTSSLLTTTFPLQYGAAWSNVGSLIAFRWIQPGELFIRLWIADAEAASVVSPFPLAATPVELGSFGAWSSSQRALAMSWRPGLTGGWRGGIVRNGGVVELLPAGVATDRAELHWSPAGNRIAWIVPTSTGAQHIYVTDVPPVGIAPTIPSSPVATIAAGASVEGFTWSPDGTRLAWYSDEGMGSEVWQLTTILSSGGTKSVIGPAVLFSNIPEIGYAWTADSARILYLRESVFGGGDIVSVDVATAAEVIPATIPTGRRVRGSLQASPDNFYVAFTDAVVVGNDESQFRLRLVSSLGLTSYGVGDAETVGAYFDWAPTGEGIAVRTVSGIGVRSIAIFEPSGPKTPYLEADLLGRAVWTGDGRWLVVVEPTSILGLRAGDDVFTSFGEISTAGDTYKQVGVR